VNFFERKITEQLQKQTTKGLLRRLRVADLRLADFYSNDYLGLARNTELRYKIEQDISGQKLSQGATGSRLLSGNNSLIESLEVKLAAIFKSSSALVFNSGYMANLGVLSSVPGKGDVILYDELIHASIKDGIRLSLADAYSFRHNDVDDLEKKIIRHGGQVYIVIESLYSMDGDIAPLKDIIQVSKKHECAIILDEAHTTGLMDSTGAGLAVSMGVHNDIDIRIYTFGKAIGTHGACVAGSLELTSFLTNFARPFIYTTALSPHAVAAISHAFDFISINTNLFESLQEKVNYYKACLAAAHLGNPAFGWIQTLLLNDPGKTKEASLSLQQQGFDVRPILPPTVKAGSERLRICLHAFNTHEEINQLIKAISELR